MTGIVGYGIMIRCIGNAIATHIKVYSVPIRCYHPRQSSVPIGFCTIHPIVRIDVFNEYRTLVEIYATIKIGCPRRCGVYCYTIGWRVSQ